MPHTMYPISVDLPGRLWIMPAPPGASLPEQIAVFRAEGVNRIVSMLPAQEAAELGLSEEAALCAREGIVFVDAPVPDFGLPEIDGFEALIHRTVGWLQAGEGVAVHCRAGIGRSGMVAACSLVAMGAAPQDAIRRVSDARGMAIPDTVEQGDFIAQFAQRVSDDARPSH